MGSTVEVSPITGGTVTSLTDAPVVSWQANQGFAYALTIAGNRQLANPSDGIVGALYVLAVTQGAGGSHTLSYGTRYKTPNGASITLSSVEGATDVLTWFYGADGSMSLVSTALNIAAPVLAPSALTATDDEVAQVTLSWTNNAADATANSVQYLDLVLGWQSLDTVAANAITYVDQFAGDRTYRIVAFRGVIPSVPSNTAAGTGLALPAPSSLTASTDQIGQITLGWTNHTGVATSIDVEYFDGEIWLPQTSLAPSAVSYVVLGAITRTFRVIAYRGIVPSDPSNTATGIGL